MSEFLKIRWNPVRAIDLVLLDVVARLDFIALL
jgi:hypothetical protein